MASALLALLLILSSACIAQGNNIIPMGSSLSPASKHKSSWSSPSGRFAFGFYSQGNGFAVGVWLDGNGTTSNKVVWTANRGDRPVSSGGQILYSGGRLISSLSEKDHSTGKFHLLMQEDGNLVLYPLDTEDTPTDAYWSTDTNKINTKYHLYLNLTTGFPELINTSDFSIRKNIIDSFNLKGNFYDDEKGSNKSIVIYSASLDFDGNFRLYTHLFHPSGGGFQTYVRWQALENMCKVKGFCGFNSFCTMNDIQPYCVCLPGTDFVDPYQNTLGCKRNYSEAHCKGGKANKGYYNITRMENIDWSSGRFYSKEEMSMDDCSTTCLEDCNCEAAKFEYGVCKKQSLPLRYLQRDNSGQDSIVFLKVGRRGLAAENESIAVEVIKPMPIIPIKRKKESMVRILLLTLSLVICSCVLLAISGLFIYKFQVLRFKRLLENGNLGLTEDLTLIIFSYHELKRATNGFKEELDKGSFGAVYKGALYKGRKPIAVKRLEKLVEEGEREFQAEMRAIGRTHHRNLVHLLGYCAEDSNRLLVYEYMSNGSLADLLFKSTRRPDWDERFKIALDVARGIQYLHEECEIPIIHLDIKPQNILMDESWTAKISDFGLAKLLMGDQTRTFTVVRGTRGYMAPEWHKNTPISVKADIFSFGIMLLEIGFCRKNLDPNLSKAEEIILSNWVYRCFVEKELDKLVLGEQVDKRSLEKLVMVALWCIQDEPALRPSIKSIVLMLEGITDIPIPPCPSSSSSSM